MKSQARGSTCKKWEYILEMRKRPTENKKKNPLTMEKKQVGNLSGVTM